MSEYTQDAIDVLGINPKTWKEYKGMYLQDDLPGMLKAEAEARESDISKIQRQTHLAKWGLRFEKYGSFSKDPKFKRRMFLQTKKCFDMMNGRE